jgi:hypothetical protein
MTDAPTDERDELLDQISRCLAAVAKATDPFAAETAIIVCGYLERRLAELDRSRGNIERPL